MALGEINKIGSLEAAINSVGTLIGSIEQKHGLVGTVTITDSAYSKYTDSYTVTPTTSDQILETKNKRMEKDLSVLAIPYFETSNLTGKTVYIGGE